jgi:glyoxylase-like metal-dependent hydrolase (beta-lactamase superfamily II)
MKIQIFTFNPFAENTYIVYDESRDCAIIDPGCYMPEEKEELLDFIARQQLKPVLLLNTHCHLDHIFGNKLIADTFGLKPMYHQLETQLLEAAESYGKQWGIYAEPSPLAEQFLNEGDKVSVGGLTFDIIFAPGHSPGSLCFYQPEYKVLFGGDVLFKQSIGRFDLPGGDEQTLLNSIREKLFVLPGDVRVLPGHGADTSIDFEKKHNPYLK